MQKKRWVYWLTFATSCVAVAILAASMGTDFWVESYPVRRVDNNTIDGAFNVTGGDLDTKFRGYIHFGLFHGYKSLDYGLGARIGEIWVECIPGESICGWTWGSYTTAQSRQAIARAVMAHRRSGGTTVVADKGLFSFGLWVCTIVFIVLAIAWGLVCMGFSAINATTRPIETIVGPMGLYLWSMLGVLFSLLALAMYVTLYFRDLKYNILTAEDQRKLWVSRDHTSLAFSFYLLLIATVLYAVNILVIALSGVQCRGSHYGSDVGLKNTDGVMMY